MKLSEITSVVWDVIKIAALVVGFIFLLRFFRDTQRLQKEVADQVERIKKVKAELKGEVESAEETANEAEEQAEEIEQDAADRDEQAGKYFPGLGDD